MVQQAKAGQLQRNVAERLVGVLGRVRRFLRAEFEGPRAGDSLTVEQAKVLNLLREGPLTMGKIAQMEGVTPAAVTGMVDRLVSRGLVERYTIPTNRRIIMVGLTSEGRRVQAHVSQQATDRAMRLFQDLSEEDQAALKSAVDVLERVLERESTEATAPAR